MNRFFRARLLGLLIACVGVVATAGALTATASARPHTIRGTDCVVSASDAPSGSLSCQKRYSVSLRVCVQVEGAHGRWFTIKGDCGRASGRTPGGIGVTVSGFRSHCNRSYRTQAIGTANGRRGTQYAYFGTTCVG